MILRSPLLVLKVGWHIGNSPNSALQSDHVTLATGWTLTDKCLDNFSCFSVAWIRLGLAMTVK